MKKRMVLLVAFLFGIGLSTLLAQEWSAAQKEVWKNVNDYWTLLAKGDLNGFLGYMHTDYVGWDNNDALPSTKEDAKKWLGYFMQGVKMPVFDIKPLAIKIYGDVAFVHYYFAYVEELPDGKKRNDHGRWTDILLRQDNKWVMIGDHGGSDKAEE
jgi:ketosteroid isomerase-like protein